MLDKITDLLENICWEIECPIKKVIWWVRYRTINKYHVIKINSLKPNYYDTDTRLLHGMFDLLVDFIEEEKAHMERIFSTEKTLKEKLLHKLIPSCFFSRSRKLGLRYLDWEISLKDKIGEYPEEVESYKSQAGIAQTIKDLYIWWKDIRPARKDPMDASGWSDFCDKHRQKIHKFRKCVDSECFEMYDELTQEEKEEQYRVLHLTSAIEKDQFEEDEAMLIKLIKVRGSLWT
jgi:hypothetical protein